MDGTTNRSDEQLLEYRDPGNFWNINVGHSIMDNNLEYRFIRDDTDLPITVVVGTSA
jgi:hypothetical protein